MTAVHATVTRVDTSTTVATLLTADGRRDGFCIQNEAAAVLYVKFGAGATATDYTVQIPAGGYYESPIGLSYVGILTGILASGSSNAQVTSLG